MATVHHRQPLCPVNEANGRISLSQVDPGLADRETVHPREMRGGGHVALAQQRQHVRGDNFRDTKHQVVLTRGQAGLGEQRGRPGHVALGQFQAGKHHRTGNPFVGVFELPRQVDVLLPVLPGGREVVPFVEDMG